MSDEEKQYWVDDPEFQDLYEVLDEWTKAQGITRPSNYEDGEVIERKFEAYIENNRRDLAKRVEDDDGIYSALMQVWANGPYSDSDDEDNEE